MSLSRRVLLLAHPSRPEAHAQAEDVARRLEAAGIEAVIAPDAPVIGQSRPAQGCELVVILGGDGTILRAAELSRGERVPLLGVNFGHVGFLAEADAEDLDVTVEHIVARRYTVQERMTLEVQASTEEGVFFSSWALNEVTVEKAARERMLELTVEIDGRPLSTWGCDGLVMATPTGSTAYAFSAGGPVIWPDVEALLLCPISAHALFARPVVVGPESALAVEVLPHTDGTGVVWCDGRRAADLPPGSRIEVRRSPEPVLLARLHDEPFTDRLVAKFDLSVHGWRGRSRQTSAD